MIHLIKFRIRELPGQANYNANFNIFNHINSHFTLTVHAYIIDNPNLHIQFAISSLTMQLSCNALLLSSIYIYEIVRQHHINLFQSYFSFTFIFVYSFIKSLLVKHKMEKESDEENQQQGNRNPIKRAEKQKQFRTVGQLKEVITDPQLMYQTVYKYSNTIKKVVNQHIRNKNINVIDFSLNARGPDEDKMYVKHSFYRSNIRRGNTLIWSNDEKKAYWGRKGLMKFFDISLNSLQAIVKQDISSISKKDQYNHYAVFTEIQNVLSCNDQLQEKDKAKVHVHRLNKANGENAQVSYFKPTDQWVVSSKNVSILVRDADDIKKYEGQRYFFAILIAKTWFNLIKQKNKKQIEKLKLDLWGKTIVGQYCGNPDFQHLVKYHETTIFFYAIVQNNSFYTCIPPIEAFKFFNEHNLPIVKNNEKSLYGKFSNYVDLGKALIQLFSEVAKSSIFQDQEGSVIYFVIEKPKVYCEFISDRYLQKTVPIPDKWQQQQVWWNVSSLGKLKTLEYRILRKLREKLRSFSRVKRGGNQDIDKKENEVKKFQQKYGSYQKQCYDLLRSQKLSKPIEYYFCVALIAFDYVFKNRKSFKSLELLNDHFLDFMSVVFWCIENKKQVTTGLMTQWKLHEDLRSQTWQKYSVEIVKDYDQLLNKIVPKYAAIKKKMKIGEQGQEQIEEKEEEDQEEGVE